jgi:hypothetical protein
MPLHRLALNKTLPVYFSEKALVPESLMRRRQNDGRAADAAIPFFFPAPLFMYRGV